MNNNYKIEELIKNNFWCSDPWTELVPDIDNSWQVCCISKPLPYTIYDKSPLEHYNSDVMNNLRNQMLNPSNYGTDLIKKFCADCVQLEQSKVISKRILLNKKIINDNILKSNIENLINKKQKYFFKRVDFKMFGNICNLKCIMCKPISSSSIAFEEFKYNGLEKEKIISIPYNLLSKEKKEKFWKDLEIIFEYTETVKFTGGEPLLNKLHFEILNFMISKNLAKIIKLHYITNMTILPEYKNIDIISIWKQFKNIKIVVSLEAYDIKNDYIRQNSKWGVIMNNIDILHNNNIYPNITSTVGNYNIYDLFELYKYITNVKNIKINFDSYVLYPSFVAVYNLPDDLKAEITDYYNKVDKNNIFKEQIKFMNDTEFDPTLWNKFVNYINKKDSIRQTNFIKIFPHFEKYWKLY